MLTREVIRGLIQANEPPCVSIYQGTHRHHPDNQQDPIRFKNLVKAVEESLKQKYSGRETKGILEPLHRIADDGLFWNHTLDGLAVLATQSSFRIFQFQRSVPDLAIVAEGFHVKPLIRIVQSADRFQVLCLTRQSARMLEGNRDALDELSPGGLPTTLQAALGDQVTTPERNMHSAGGSTIQHGQGSRKDEVDKDTERYFRAVDREVQASFSKPSGLPLLLAALTEHQPIFRGVSQNPALLDDGIAGNPEAVGLDRIRADAWKLLEPWYLGRLKRLSEDFQTAAAHQKGTADLSDAARAAVEGRVGMLLIEDERLVPGRIDPTTGAIAPAELSDPDVGDMLDDLAEIVLRTGGDVVIVPRDRMPSRTGLAATLRF